MKKRFRRSLAGSPVWFGFIFLSAIVLLLGLAACSSSSAGTSGGTSGATTAPNNTPAGAAVAGSRLSFKQTTYEVGQINRNADNGKEYRIPFTNSGTAALTVSDVKVEPLDPTT